MEFPDLGQHCSNLDCKQLDFLPMRCDACSQIFCKEHIKYDTHGCEEGFRKDVQVPVCPLCNKPVPAKRGEAPDIRVSEHIDRDCQSDRAVKKRKVFPNKCSRKGCKQKELMPLICDSCRLNFCLKHRHALDHECKGFQGTGSGLSNSGFAAMNRAASSAAKKTASKPQQRPQQQKLGNIGADLARERREREAARQRANNVPNVYSMQAGMSEDEAMARALHLSMQSSTPTVEVPPTKTQQEEADMALARALAQSEEEQQRAQTQGRQQSRSDSSKCTLS